jgi:hypothetical protein
MITEEHLKKKLARLTHERKVILGCYKEKLMSMTLDEIFKKHIEILEYSAKISVLKEVLN